MNATNRYHSTDARIATAALRAAARDLPLADVLLELRDLYRDERNEPALQGIRDHEVFCNTAVRALDTALWRLQSVEVVDPEGA